LNFTDALALLRRMEHSTLHDWIDSTCIFHIYLAPPPQILAPNTTHVPPTSVFVYGTKIKNHKKIKYCMVM
jgi:hypothetical protein